MASTDATAEAERQLSSRDVRAMGVRAMGFVGRRRQRVAAARAQGSVDADRVEVGVDRAPLPLDVVKQAQQHLSGV